MATYVLIHGSGGDSGYWQFVVPELKARGHEVVAPDLPVEDDSAVLQDYADHVVKEIGDRTGLIVVAQSLAGFIAPIVCDQVRADLLVFVNAMIPAPGETAGAWWGDTGVDQARHEADVAAGRDPNADFDPVAMFLHDLSPERLAVAMAEQPKPQSDTIFGQPYPLTEWPDVPTKILSGTLDRFFPIDFQRRVAKERLGITPDTIESGHLPALGHPVELVEQLEKYRVELGK
ncbi:pimeloyl-ACP methyl ester carboxylesterase [Allocatelliglobosispora scoriae]|uniref:Pimeloyl-ACP methyl ester carboxylesterase n=1 Tax=Allocatelliglobosispora scoriae TaxID=643052 RepID=A0A841BTA8_9ACTN|nr:alpha/beta hydrolase [Allocatelliglobosispora scoriae]MBB5870020.1 pimeloyl-ACP methyl ester carboxylesterase [Allocatelliglobosispora scoriae]